MQEKSSKEAVAVQPVSERPVSPLRERMLALMAERGFAEATRAAYVKGVLGLVERCGGRGPEAITVDEARAYVAWLKSSGASPAVRSNASAGLRFLYESVLGRTWKPVSTLRQRMSDDLEMRGFAAKTRASYLRSVSRLAKYFGVEGVVIVHYTFAFPLFNNPAYAGEFPPQPPVRLQLLAHPFARLRHRLNPHAPRGDVVPPARLMMSELSRHVSTLANAGPPRNACFV